MTGTYQKQTALNILGYHNYTAWEVVCDAQMAFGSPVLPCHSDNDFSGLPRRGIAARARRVSSAFQHSGGSDVVADLARYDAAIDGHRFLKTDTQETAWTPTKSNLGRPLKYGLGWFVQKYRGLRLVWHYGNWDGVSSLYIKVPEKNITFILLANANQLSDRYPLGLGNVTKSPAARASLNGFVRE